MKKIIFEKIIFDLNNIGQINSNLSFIEHQGEVKFFQKIA